MYTPVQDLNLWKKRSKLAKAVSETLILPPYKAMQWIRGNPGKATQAREAARVPELFLEQLWKLRKNRRADFTHFLKALSHWGDRYFETQKAVGDLDYFLLYTKKDHEIPLTPQADDLYAYIMPALVNLGVTASKILNPEQSKYITDSVHGLNIRAQKAFLSHPARVPRFENHNRVSLNWVQSYDDPLTACPSLHVAYSVFMYNIAKNVLNLESESRYRKDKDLQDTWDSVRTTAYGMLHTVLHVKQHSLVDVAVGILCAKMEFEEKYPGHKFDDLTDKFEELKIMHPGIHYDVISEDFAHINEAYEQDKTQGLVALLDMHISERGYKKVAAGTTKVLYNMATGEIEKIAA